MAASAAAAGSSDRMEKGVSPAQVQSCSGLHSLLSLLHCRQDLKRRLHEARKAGIAVGGLVICSHLTVPRLTLFALLSGVCGGGLESGSEVGRHGRQQGKLEVQGDRKRPAAVLAPQVSVEFESKLSQRAKRFQPGVHGSGGCSSPAPLRSDTLSHRTAEGTKKRPSPGSGTISSGIASIHIKSFEEIMREKRAKREAEAAMQATNS